ncbi:MAG: hypothetical protein NDF57_05935 [archaeon GBS-70-058]|nr:hypothetical protein [Candidatus Culexarchaeum nevadense]
MTLSLCLSFMDFTEELALVSVDMLYPHEEIIPSILNRLVEDIRDCGVFKDPIMVDSNSNVVLDGMHRLAASKVIGFKWIPVCYVDYMSDRVKVYRWWRVISGSGFREFVEKSFNVDFLDRSVIDDYISKYPLLVFRDGFYLFHASGVFESLLLVKDLEASFSSRGFSVSYDLESDALSKLDSGVCSAVLTLPSVSKRDVVLLALSGKILPHKSTRHVFPFRPMGINLPLNILFMDSFEEASIMFINHIKSKVVKIYPPGCVIDRKYDEYLYVFEG